jgi:hypothetical protein
MTLFQEGTTVSNNKLILPVVLKTIIIKYNKYHFKQYIHIHNKISQSEFSEYNVIIIRYSVLTLNNLYISFWIDLYFELIFKLGGKEFYKIVPGLWTVRFIKLEFGLGTNTFPFVDDLNE